MAAALAAGQTSGAARRLRDVARSHQRLHPVTAAGFQRDLEFFADRSFGHGESEQRHAAGRESAGDYARVARAADFRIARTAQRTILRQRPLLSAILPLLPPFPDM